MPEKMSKATKYFLADAMAADKFREKRPDKENALMKSSFGKCCLPRDDYHEVHDVPHVSQVASGMKDESLCQYLEACLNSKDAQEIRLC